MPNDQYTLTDADSNELNHWAAIYLEKLRAAEGITDVASDQANELPDRRSQPIECAEQTEDDDEAGRRADESFGQ